MTEALILANGINLFHLQQSEARFESHDSSLRVAQRAGVPPIETVQVFRVADPAQVSKGRGFDFSRAPWHTNSFATRNAAMCISSLFLAIDAGRFYARCAPEMRSSRFLARGATAVTPLRS